MGIYRKQQGCIDAFESCEIPCFGPRFSICPKKLFPGIRPEIAVRNGKVNARIAEMNIAPVNDSADFPFRIGQDISFMQIAVHKNWITFHFYGHGFFDIRKKAFFLLKDSSRFPFFGVLFHLQEPCFHIKPVICIIWDTELLGSFNWKRVVLFQEFSQPDGRLRPARPGWS
ncbi:Uncharacterised protein [Mycobacteroides abscessus subsp. abscessus]|nr:Uncharacterised protein [Mycobacteroides abscessus subsp. abscessus]